MKSIIIPSIIAHSQAELDERINKIKQVTKFIQLDVMDGQFVPHTSLEFEWKLPRGIKAEAHLMIEHPTPWIHHNQKKVKGILVHYKADAHIHELIALAKKCKKQFGIALNPDVPAEAIAQYLHHVNKVLVMTVTPGKYGSSFLPAMLRKIQHLREMAPRLDIEVDGGITPRTLAQCKAAGANQFVVGSFLQNAREVKQAWRALGKAIKA